LTHGASARRIPTLNLGQECISADNLVTLCRATRLGRTQILNARTHMITLANFECANAYDHFGIRLHQAARDALMIQGLGVKTTYAIICFPVI
jgi:hypothetical protein